MANPGKSVFPSFLSTFLSLHLKSIMQEATNLYSCLGDNSIAGRIASAKVLVVGAGGIGCEILKNLVLSGFKSTSFHLTLIVEIKVIDLDTIEMSNLNRQFLFRKEHIGKSKALVAASVVRRLVGMCGDHMLGERVWRGCGD